MDSGQKALIQASFRRVLTVADLAGELFSGRLYLLDPGLWLLLDIGSRERQRALVRMLAAAVEDLDRFDHLASTLEAVARRSVAQGMNEAHLTTISETLLWTLQQVLGDSFDERLAAAWRAASTLLVGRMQGAAIAQAIEPMTLRRLRCSSCPDLREGAFHPLAVLPPVHDAAGEDAEIGRLAELPPPPTSVRV